MIEVKPLPESYSWKGQLYKKGSTQIPESLAQALGLAQHPKEQPSEPAAEQSPEQRALMQAEPEQKTQNRRSKK